MALSPAITQAGATYYWDPSGTQGTGSGGPGAWNTSDKFWSDNAGNDVAWSDTSPTGSDTAVFSGSSGTVTLDSNLSSLGLQFLTAGYSLSGTGVLTLGGSGIDASQLPSGATTIGAGLAVAAAQTWQTATGTTLTLSAPISDAPVAGGPFTVTVGTSTATGTITLGGSTANTFSGLWSLAGGTLQLNKTAGTDSIGAGGFQGAAGTTLNWLADNQVNDAASIETQGTITFNGHSETLTNLTLDGAATASTAATNGAAKTFNILGTLTIASSNGSAFTLNTNSAPGTLTTLSVRAMSLTSTGGFLMGANSTAGLTTLTIGSGGLSMMGQGEKILINVGGSTGAKGASIILGGDVTTGGSTGSNTITTNNLTVAAGSTYTIDLGGAVRTFDIGTVLTISSGSANVNLAIVNGGILKKGSAALNLNTVNSYSGPTTIDAGVLLAGSLADINTPSAI
ncbi:MAG TPA: hypothetical protein VLJ39_16445, partial [Tepidisphaeraceae bacterium]|nr:hypothetical protein [Tepidisphaeraceae bacterium]